MLMYIILNARFHYQFIKIVAVGYTNNWINRTEHACLWLNVAQASKCWITFESTIHLHILSFLYVQLLIHAQTSTAVLLNRRLSEGMDE